MNRSIKDDDRRLDTSAAVVDSRATLAKQLLNAYIYDFLIKSRLPKTANAFVNEADIPSAGAGAEGNSDGSAPGSAKSATGPPAADNAIKSPLLLFYKENNLPALRVAMDAPQGFLFEWWQVFWDVYQAKSGGASSDLASQYYQLQLMKQKQQEYYAFQQGHPGPGPQAVGPAGPAGPAGPQNQVMAQMMMKQPYMDPQQQAMQNKVQQQQMFMMQQQQQQSNQNRIQKIAQIQMNNLRQAAAVKRESPTQNPAGTNGQFNAVRQNVRSENNGQISSNNINALQDYQMQLMLLEKQNKKRLDIARSSGSGDPNVLASLNAGMLPPYMQVPGGPNQPLQNPTPTQNPAPNPVLTSHGHTPINKPLPALTGPLPVMGNKTLPGGKKKKEAAKRGRKPSAAAGASGGATPGSNGVGAHLKKEFSTPLTPTSETPENGGKRKRKSSVVGESPKKAVNKKASIIKEENEDKKDDSLNTMIPPSSFHDLAGDQMFLMEVLETSNDGQLFHQNNDLDIDFDFNSFLDGNSDNNFVWSVDVENE